MPVGCLGNAARGQPEEAFQKNGFETILTSSRLNNTDQFAFMQHTLLLQIFRDHVEDDRSSPGTSDSGSILCPTCVGFSDQCCQQDSGIDIFHCFIEANLNCLWDLRLSEAISSLRYQGYICPGILVLIANSSHLEVVSDAWHRRLLTSPAGCRICQVGVSNGCLVKPIVQTHTVSLPDFLCLLLARLKRTDQTVDMETLVKGVEEDWTGVAPFCRTNGVENLKETIHTSLGALIKQRKIYYTGNKGYFLVGNDGHTNRGTDLKSWRRSLPKRLSFRNGSNKNNNVNNQSFTDKECQTEVAQETTPHPKASPVRFESISPKNHDTSSPGKTSLNGTSGNEMSPNSVTNETSSFNLERSQSLRISKNSLRNISKGGSLRFSRKEAAKLLSEEAERNLSIEASNGETTPQKPFERKNSFLGKIFGGSSKKRSANSGPKPVILTFSAQFPPPELPEDHHATYQALKKAAQSICEASPISPQDEQRILEDLYARPRNGIRNNGSETMPDGCGGGGMPIYSKVSPFRHAKKETTVTACNGTQDQKNIYGVGSPLNIYAYSIGGENVYSYPPPPLPYRPNNWGSGPNSLQSSSSSTSSPTHRQFSSPSNHSVSPSRATSSPLSVKPTLQQPQYQHQLQQQQQQQQQQHQQQHQRQQKQYQETNQPQYLESNHQPYQETNHHLYQTSSHHQHFQSNNNESIYSPWTTPSKRSLNNSANNSSALNGNNSVVVTSSSSNDSLILESRTTRPLFDDDLIVIERSNRELELRLSANKNPPGRSSSDDSPSGKGSKNRAIRFTLPTNHKNRSAVVVDTIHNNNGTSDVIYEDMGDEGKLTKVTRPLSECFTTKDDMNFPMGSTPQSFPSIGDLPSVAELSGTANFKSLTAQKLMSGLSFNSIDTLLEVNAAADARSNFNESTETIDFGVI